MHPNRSVRFNRTERETIGKTDANRPPLRGETAPLLWSRIDEMSQTNSTPGQGDKIDLSVVIPLRRCDISTLRRLDAIERLFPSEGTRRVEILVVIGETEEGADRRLVEFTRTHPRIVLIRDPGPRGIGYSARQGILLSRGSRVLLAIAEPIGLWSTLPAMERGLDQDHDLVVAGSRIRDRSLPPVRIGREIVRRLLRQRPPGICNGGPGGPFGAFHLYDRNTAFQIYQRQRTDGEGFLIEVLYLARLYGFSAFETGSANGVVQRQEEGSDSIPLPGLRELFRIGYNRLRGDYG